MLSLTRRKSKRATKPELIPNNQDTLKPNLRLLEKEESSIAKLPINSTPEGSLLAFLPDQDNLEDAMVTFSKVESLNSTKRNSREERSEH